MRTASDSPFFLCPPYIQPKVFYERKGIIGETVVPATSIHAALSVSLRHPWIVSSDSAAYLDFLRMVYEPYIAVVGLVNTYVWIQTANDEFFNDEFRTFGPYILSSPRFHKTGTASSTSLGCVVVRLPVVTRYIRFTTAGSISAYITQVFFCDHTSIVQPTAGFQWSVALTPRLARVDLELGDARKVGRSLGPLRVDLRFDLIDPLVSDLLFRLNEHTNTPLLFVENLDWSAIQYGQTAGSLRAYCGRLAEGVTWTADSSGCITGTLDLLGW